MLRIPKITLSKLIQIAVKYSKNYFKTLIYLEVGALERNIDLEQ